MTTNIQLREGEGLNPGSPSFHLDTVNQCVWLGAQQISLSPKAFSVLHHLAERAGSLVTKQELLDAVWPDVFVTEGVLKRAILEIRKGLSDSAEAPRFIQTLHRRGYRFLAQQSAAKSESARHEAKRCAPDPQIRRIARQVLHVLRTPRYAMPRRRYGYAAHLGARRPALAWIA